MYNPLSTPQLQNTSSSSGVTNSHTNILYKLYWDFAGYFWGESRINILQIFMYRSFRSTLGRLQSTFKSLFYLKTISNAYKITGRLKLGVSKFMIQNFLHLLLCPWPQLRFLQLQTVWWRSVREFFNSNE